MSKLSVWVDLKDWGYIYFWFKLQLSTSMIKKWSVSLEQIPVTTMYLAIWLLMRLQHSVVSEAVMQ